MVLDSLLKRITDGQIRRFAVALLLSLSVSAVIAWLIDHSAQGMARRGDFPAFYAAARIILIGSGEDLYQPELQAAVENRYWPSLEGRYLYFAYPPYVALLAAPFGYLSPVAAKLLFTGLMLLSLYAATKALIRCFPILTGQTLTIFTALFAFGPVYAGVLGGQNTALSMLLYFSAAAFLLENSRSGDVKAGACLGLWCFKPHFCAIALLFAVLAGRTRVILGAVLPLLFAYAGGAIVLNNLLWPLSWLEAVKAFAASDLEANGYQMVSLPAVAARLGRYSEFPLELFGYLLAGFLLLVLLFRVKEAREHMKEEDFRLLLVSAIGPAAVFLSPHALFYDLGLCLLSLCFLSLKLGRRAFLPGLLLYIAAFAACILREEFAVQPLMLLGALLTIHFARKRALS